MNNFKSKLSEKLNSEIKKLRNDASLIASRIKSKRQELAEEICPFKKGDRIAEMIYDIESSDFAPLYPLRIVVFDSCMPSDGIKGYCCVIRKIKKDGSLYANTNESYSMYILESDCEDIKEGN